MFGYKNNKTLHLYNQHCLKHCKYNYWVLVNIWSKAHTVHELSYLKIIIM